MTSNIGVGLKVTADVSEAVSQVNRLPQALNQARQSYNAPMPGDGGAKAALPDAQGMIRELRDQFLKDTRLGGYSDEINQKFGALLDSFNRTAAVPAPPGDGGAKAQPSLPAADTQLSLRNQFLKDSSLGGYSKADEINKRFESILSSIGSSDRALNKSLQSGDLEGTKNYGDLLLGFRNQYLKDAQLAGYKDVKLDSKPLENAIVNLTAIMNQMMAEGKSREAKGYGDILKSFQGQLTAENTDERRTRMAQDQQTRFLRGVTRLLGQGQNVIGQAGAGNVAGAALGAAGGIDDLLKSLPKGALIGGAVVGGIAAVVAGANKLSEQWEKVMQPSMGLAASLGRLGDDAGKNHAVFQEVFARATDRRVLHGYSLEEGIALASQLSKSGTAADNVIGGEEQVFRYQRMTDADRGTLAQAVGYAGRYRGGENVLGYAYGGTKESGMEHGQYQEYLNATLRIFEEGLSKGVVKGFAEITRTQNMLAMIGDTWKGDQGAEKYARMNDAVTGAYKLQSDYDVIMYQAASVSSYTVDIIIITWYTQGYETRSTTTPE